MGIKKFNAAVFLTHYICDTCNTGTMQFTGNRLSEKSLEHICTNSACKTTKYLDAQYPYTVIDIVNGLTPVEEKNEQAPEEKAEAEIRNINDK